MFPPPFQDVPPALVALYLLGLLLSLGAGIWFLVVGFKQDVLWGLAMLCGCGFGQLAFLIVHFQKAWKPALLALTGTMFMLVPAGIIGTQLGATVAEMQAKAAEQEAQRAAKAAQEAAQEAAVRAANPVAETPVPVEPTVPDEPTVKPTPPVKPTAPTAKAPTTNITLTGAKRSAYKQLLLSKAWTVIRWANADVTDADLEVLHGFAELRELDLSNTQVTDEGLHAIEACDKLEVLKLNGTAVTEEGFREHVLPIETLTTLDIRGTKIPKKVGREWKAAAEGRTLQQ